MKPSKQFTLNIADFKAVARSGAIFLAPLALIYLTQVTGAIQAEHHVISLHDFLPTSFTLGAISLYITNRLTDLVRKFIDGK